MERAKLQAWGTPVPGLLPIALLLGALTLTTSPTLAQAGGGGGKGGDCIKPAPPMKMFGAGGKKNPQRGADTGGATAGGAGSGTATGNPATGKTDGGCSGPRGGPKSGTAGSAAAGATGSGQGAGLSGFGRAGSTFELEDPDGLLAPDTWQLWWHDNQDRFLDLQGRRVDPTLVTGLGVLTGRGRAPELASQRGAAPDVEREILPTLLALVAQGGDPELLAPALIALGRCAPATHADAVSDAVRPQLASKVLSVQASAVLALGIDGSPRSVPLLGALMADAPAGRAAVGGPVPPLLRALASLSLGLGQHAAAVPLLTEQLGTLPDAQVELKSCTIAALGVFDGHAGAEAAVELLALLADRRVDSPIRLQVPLALARLDNGRRLETVPALLAAFVHRDTDDLVRASAAQALGRLADARQRDVVDALARAVRKAHHAGTRHAAVMALGEIGQRAARDRSAGADVAHMAEVLEQSLDKARQFGDRPWAALAAAVFAHAGAPEADGLRSRLAEAYLDQNDAETRGALALAAGLAGARDATPALIEDVRGAGDPSLKGHAALALGLLGVIDAAPEMLAACADPATEPLLRERLSLALSLLRDPDVVPTLLGLLERMPGHPAGLGAARVLGRIGDGAAVLALVAVARDEALAPSSRSTAVAALGQLGERGAQPWNRDLHELRNSEAPVEALLFALDVP